MVGVREIGSDVVLSVLSVPPNPMKLLRRVANESSLLTEALSRRRCCGCGGVVHFRDDGDGDEYRIESRLCWVDLVLVVSLLALEEPELLYECDEGK